LTGERYTDRLRPKNSDVALVYRERELVDTFVIPALVAAGESFFA